ncbi:MAG: glycosyltransferase family 2 protein [Candidatus Micrarchaeia archaeon]
MNNEPILTFAIPTWNRCNELRECLDHLVKEIENTKEFIEIFVSDNASTDSTSQVLEEYSKKYYFIRYSRNKRNLGFDLNLINAIEKSKGKYVWTFSDDDIIAEGSLNRVIEIINKYNPTYIAVDYDQFYSGKEQNGQIIIIKPNKITKYNHKVLLSLWLNLNFRDLLDKEFTRVTLISINIFRRSSLNLNSVKNNIDKSKHFPHVYLIAQATEKGGAIILPNICVHQREDNSNTNPIIFYKNLPDLMEFIFSEYHLEKSYVQKFFKNYRKNYLSFLDILSLSALLKIYRKKIDIEQINKNLSKVYISFYFKFIFPIIPRKFVIILAKIYRAYRGKGFTIASEKELRFE